MQATDLPLGDIDAGQFAKAIAETPDDQLAEGMRSPARGQMLDEIFRRMEQHFDPTKSAGMDLVISFTITDQQQAEPNRYRVVIRDETCSTGAGAADDAELGLTLDGVDFLKLVANQVNGMDLYLESKMKIDGSMILATRITGLFAMPVADEAGSGGETQTKGAVTDVNV